ncbi:MAG: hydroxypyruvate isomerase [Mariniblastus sp.]|jgi:hydroxypyruvate isomerase
MPTQKTNRRQFIAASSTLAIASAATPMFAQSATPSDQFKLAFAPHPRMFKTLSGKEVLDQIRFTHDQGFTAREHKNSIPGEKGEQAVIDAYRAIDPK